MKTKQTYMMLLVAVAALIIGAGATASAGALGDDYVLAGYQIGWWVLGVAVIIGILAFLDVLDKKKVGTGAIVILLIGVALLVPITAPEEAEPGTIYITPAAQAVPTFEIAVGKAGPTYASNNTGYSSVQSDDTTLMTLLCGNNDALIGGTSFNASNLALIAGVNNQVWLNFTVTPVPPTGASTTDLATVYFRTDYAMKYNGEWVLNTVATGERFARFKYGLTTPTLISTKYYSGQCGMAMNGNAYVNLTYEFDSGTDSFAEEVNDCSVGETGTPWYITFYNADNSWTKTYTVNWVYMGAA